ncbi:hypothetical protein ESB00_03995 [Oleiharenicola lentus]|uniref:Uncharacterized protein n=1 Tax=Oleiharenicola lentus TaxID=2508720 RepID=A0A4Q1C8A7_9BACT|nr:hypothetical protein [Oleiharenicola lentus]RXK55071.1 hypothetical protein ESB00_03995 [Oleiharenicola lentus]
MKTHAQRYLALLSLMALTACAQIRHPTQITFKVVDDLGSPVTAGIVRASTFSYWKSGEGFGRDVNEHYKASINKDGIAVLEGSSLRGSLAYGVYPEGNYYPGFGGEYRFKQVENGRWEPWNPQVEIVVPRIVNPIPLYARRYGLHERASLPIEGAVGFDLVVSDWVPPYGKGKTADFIFDYRTIVPLVDEQKAFECVLNLTFMNPGDGIVSRQASPARRLIQLPRQAPEEGYEPKWTKRFGRLTDVSDLLPHERENLNYFFRVRTVLDSSGKVVSAHYGKIYGDIVFDAVRHLRFTYYINPTPLDRNLEFNPKRNLFSERLTGTDAIGP